MARKKPFDPVEQERKARAIYDSERRAFRLGLFFGVPVTAVILLIVKESKALPIEWPLVIFPPVAVALYCCLAWASAEFNWRSYCRRVAQRAARGFEVLTDKPDENQKA